MTEDITMSLQCDPFTIQQKYQWLQQNHNDVLKFSDQCVVAACFFYNSRKNTTYKPDGYMLISDATVLKFLPAITVLSGKPIIVVVQRHENIECKSMQLNIVRLAN